MINDVLLIAIVALVTIALRFLPFVIFSGKRQTPAYISYLGKVLPFSIMGMLVIYCLRNISFATPAGWIPAAVSTAVPILLYLWKKNMVLPMAGGTICCILLMHLL